MPLGLGMPAIYAMTPVILREDVYVKPHYKQRPKRKFSTGARKVVFVINFSLDFRSRDTCLFSYRDQSVL